MKFGKEFRSQMVPEWQEAYMDYNFLKSILKDIMKFRRQQHVGTDTSASVLRRRGSLYRAFSGLTSKYSRNSPRKKEDEEVILVSSVRSDDPQAGVEGPYQTMFLKHSEEGGEYELVFFRRLDDEFNKVVKFYKDKVKEVVAEADELSRQMNLLIALKIKVEKKPAEVHAAFTSPSSINDNRRRPAGMTRMGLIQEVEMSSEEHIEEGDGRTTAKIREDVRRGTQAGNFRPAPLQVLDDVKINVDPETPISTVKAILMNSSLNSSFNRSELRQAEEIMINAFTEFHERLRILKNYCFLNQLAFSKIMKKYDKITSRNASKAYVKMVDDSFLGSSEEVNKLMEKVEKAFVKHFANGNRRKGMRTLRPTAKREKHRTTFLMGFFSGFSLALIVTVLVVVHARNLLGNPNRNKYMQNIFPLYSLFGFIVLHMIMYAGNIYFWKRYRINYPFIFEFKQGTELGYREVLLLSSGLAVITLGCVLSNLDMEMDARTGNYKTLTELVPLALLTFVMLITFCPFNIIYRSSRYFLIGVVFHCIFAPFYKVTLPDFFLADQLTSQVQAFRNLEFYICYYGWGDFKKRSSVRCEKSKVFETFYFIVAVIPYWLRFLQCLRRLLEEKDKRQAYNGIKYLSTIVALVMRTLHERNDLSFWMIMAAATSGFATIINTYWDIVMDWGLLRRNSKNPWLRDKLVISNKSIYFIAMVLNVILRLAWMQTVIGFRSAPFLHRTALTAIVACLEIIRRGIWNFFRLENEHLNNVGKYRAFKSVPLPFQHGNYKNI